MATNPKLTHTAELLRVKAILQDGDFYAAVLFPALAYFDPHAAHWIVQNWPVLAPYVLVIAGRLGVRITGVRAAGRVATALATPERGLPGLPLNANPPTGTDLPEQEFQP